MMSRLRVMDLALVGVFLLVMKPLGRSDRGGRGLDNDDGRRERQSQKKRRERSY
jgi:hypothetical protein